MIGNTKGLPAVVLVFAWQPLLCVEHVHLGRVSFPHVCQAFADAAAQYTEELVYCAATVPAHILDHGACVHSTCSSCGSA